MRMRLVWMIPLSRLLIIILEGVLLACVGLDLVCTLSSLFILFGCIHCCVACLYIHMYIHASKINDHIIIRITNEICYKGQQGQAITVY